MRTHTKNWNGCCDKTPGFSHSITCMPGTTILNQKGNTMTHRTEVFSLSDRLTVKEAFPLMVQKGFSRVPLHHDIGP